MLFLILPVTFMEKAMNEQEFWKSAYTELIHKVKGFPGAWARVQCVRFSIPGRVVEQAEGELCTKCFSLDEQAHLAQAVDKGTVS